MVLTSCVVFFKLFLMQGSCCLLEEALCSLLTTYVVVAIARISGLQPACHLSHLYTVILWHRLHSCALAMIILISL